MKLNDMAVRKAKPEDKPYKLSGGGGMYLERLKINIVGSSIGLVIRKNG